jgi:hypothetical protein
MELAEKPLANPAVAYREGVDGWAVLVNLDTAGSLALNPTGVVVWQLVDGQRTVEQIVSAVQRHFRDAPPTVTDDVSELLDTLAEEGFIGFEWTPGDMKLGT